MTGRVKLTMLQREKDICAPFWFSGLKPLIQSDGWRWLSASTWLEIWQTMFCTLSESIRYEYKESKLKNHPPRIVSKTSRKRYPTVSLILLQGTTQDPSHFPVASSTTAQIGTPIFWVCHDHLLTNVCWCQLKFGVGNRITFLELGAPLEKAVWIMLLDLGSVQDLCRPAWGLFAPWLMQACSGQHTTSFHEDRIVDDGAWWWCSRWIKLFQVRNFKFYDSNREVRSMICTWKPAQNTAWAQRNEEYEKAH